MIGAETIHAPARGRPDQQQMPVRDAEGMPSQADWRRKLLSGNQKTKSRPWRQSKTIVPRSGRFCKFCKAWVGAWSILHGKRPVHRTHRGNLSRIGDCGTSGADRLISETCLTAVGGADRQTVGSPPKPTRNFLAGRRRLPDTVGARFSSPSDGGDGRRCGGESFTETRRRKGRKKTYWKYNATCEKGTRGPSFPP